MSKKVKIFFEIDTETRDFIMADLEDFDGDEPDEERCQEFVDEYIRNNVSGFVSRWRIEE